MHKLFHRFSKKDVKILKRELALAHIVIALLALGMLGLLSVIDMSAEGYVRGLIDAASALLILVVLGSALIATYIFRLKK